MKCKECSLCRGFWSFGRQTQWGWKCTVLNTVVFHINKDEAVLLGLPSPPIFESYKEHHREDDIKVWQWILNIDCVASTEDVIQFVDESQNEILDIDVKLSSLMDDKQWLQDDIYQASIVLGEMKE